MLKIQSIVGSKYKISKNFIKLNLSDHDDLYYSVSQEAGEMDVYLSVPGLKA